MSDLAIAVFSILTSLIIVVVIPFVVSFFISLRSTYKRNDEQNIQTSGQLRVDNWNRLLTSVKAWLIYNDLRFEDVDLYNLLCEDHTSMIRNGWATGGTEKLQKLVDLISQQPDYDFRFHGESLTRVMGNMIMLSGKSSSYGVHNIFDANDYATGVVRYQRIAS